MRYSFCILIFLFGFLFFSEAYSQVSSFTVSNVTVDVTAENALDARTQAFEKAQRDAFVILSERTGFNGSSIADQTIATFIQDYEVTNEKLSNVRYVGTYTFRFNESAIRNYFGGFSLEAGNDQATQTYSPTSQAGQTVSESRANTFLILPFYQEGQKVTLWSPQNVWMHAWNKSQIPNQMVLPLGDLEDVRDIGDSQGLRYDERGLQNMLRRYDAKDAVFVIAKPSGAILNVDIYNSDRVEYGPTRRVTVSERRGQGMQAAFEEAVLKVQDFLKNNPVSQEIIDRQGGYGYYNVSVPLKSLSEWASTQKALERVYGLTSLTVQSFSPSVAELSFYFDGHDRALAGALSQAGMSLIGDAGGQSSHYTVYLNKYAASHSRGL